MSLIRVCWVFCACLIFTSNSFAWNSLGHQVIASIAYHHLKPEVRLRVDAIIANFALEYPVKNNITAIAIWPDEIREHNITLFSHWHYLDKSFSDDGTPVKNLDDTDNILWALPKLSAALKNLKTNPLEQVFYFAFLVHLVADIHQPLHTTSRISAAHLNGDLGGNLFLLEAATPALYPKRNLHTLWDEGCGIFNAKATAKKIAALERSITASYPEEYFGKAATDLKAADWVEEGFMLAKNTVYATTENQSPTTAYLVVGKDISAQKAALAGYRLANLLNELLS